MTAGLDHPITRGRIAQEQVRIVETYTGQSLDGPPASTLLALPPEAVDYVPPPPAFQEAPAGKAQGLAFSLGRGRVVVLGEAGMLSAQSSPEGMRFGMNAPGFDNRQFALNIMHWLSGALGTGEGSAP